MIPIVAGIKAAFTGGKGKVLEAANNLIDNLVTNKEEREQKKIEFAQVINAHELEVINAGIKADEMRIQDIQNARSMQIAALGQDDKFSKRYVYYLATFVILSAVIFGILLFFIPVPEANKRMVEMFCDIFLFAGAMMVMQFFFGSSVGSRRSSEAMRTQIANTQNAGAEKTPKETKDAPDKN